MLGTDRLGFSSQEIVVAGTVGVFGLLLGVKGGLLGLLTGDVELLLGGGEVVVLETVIEPDDEGPRRQEAGDETGDEQW